MKRRFILLVITASLLSLPAKAQEEAAKVSDTPALERPNAEQIQPTNKYVHQWIKLPEVSGQSAKDGSTITVRTRPGYATAILFLASYNEPSQEIILDFMRMEKKFSALSTDFYYVFTGGDVKDDVMGFMEEFKIDRAMLSNDGVDESYHSPQLPTIYIGDRHGWLTKRYLGASDDDVKDMEQFLDRLTSL